MPTAKLREAVGAPFDTGDFSTALQPTADGYVLLLTSRVTGELATVRVSRDEELVAAKLPRPEATGPLSHQFGFVARSRPADQFVRVRIEQDGDLRYFTSQAIEPGVGFAPERRLFSFLYREQVLSADLGTSLDGARALFAASGITWGPVQVVVLGADGAAVGPVRDLPSPQLNACLEIVPTEQAGALSYVEHREGVGYTWHLVELDRLGDVVLDVAEPVSGCPSHLTSAPGHFAALLQNPGEAPSVIRFARGQRKPSPVKQELGGGASSLGILPQASSTLLVGRSGNSGELAITRVGAGQWATSLRTPRIPYGETRMLPNAQGDLTLTVATSHGLEIFTIACPEEPPPPNEPAPAASSPLPE